MSDSTRHPAPPLLAQAAGGLAHPLVLVSVLTLVLNDHWWKLAYPSFITGKLSDFSGLIFFPLLLQAVVEVAQAIGKHYRGPSQKILLVMIAVTALGFAWVKTTHTGQSAYASVLTVAREPFLAIRRVIVGSSDAWGAEPRTVIDPSDLMALPSLLITYLIGRSRSIEHPN